jgi:hypothetical protein
MHLFGSKSSVGSPMNDLLLMFVVMLAVGIYEAQGRRLVGRLVCGVLGVIDGGIALCLTNLAVEAMDIGSPHPRAVSGFKSLAARYRGGGHAAGCGNGGLAAREAHELR